MKFTFNEVFNYACFVVVCILLVNCIEWDLETGKAFISGAALTAYVLFRFVFKPGGGE